jgi:DNA-binding transcriptional LysR family regulator
MLDDIRALVHFAEAGTIVAAASRLHRTPSAVTRQIQRLEASLRAELLDRSVKPPRLNPLGIRILEESREVLKRLEQLRAVADNDAEPSGVLRIGVSHALADGALVKPVHQLSAQFPRLRVRLSTELTGDLFNRLSSGELDVAAVILPEGRTAPAPLHTSVVATDRMLVVRRREGRRRSRDLQELARGPWILNPPVCLLRASFLEEMEQIGAPVTVAAEIHNMHLQLAFVERGAGFGLLPSRFVAHHGSRDRLQVLEPPGFSLPMAIAVVRSGPLGLLEQAVAGFEDELHKSFADGLRRPRKAAARRAPIRPRP